MARQSTSSPLIAALSAFDVGPNAAQATTTASTRGRSPELRRFLEKYSFLVPLLQEIRIKLRCYFPDSSASLDIVTDPEEVGREQVVISIATDRAPREALDTLEQFDRDWWLDNLDRAQGKVCIDVEFR